MAKSPIKAKRDNKGRFIKPAGMKFPQINRLITAPHRELTSSRGLRPRLEGAFLRGKPLSFLASVHLWRWLIALVILSILLLQLVQLGQKLYSSYNEAQLKQAEKRAVEAEITKWQKVVLTRPDYRDGYFELAILTYRLGRTQETRNYLNKVFELDPNYEPAREFEKTIGK